MGAMIKAVGYGCDLLDRLTTATCTGLTQGWTYDANGNRPMESGSTPLALMVSPSSNRVTTNTGTLTRSLGYDAAGNTTADSAPIMTCNDAGRMTSCVRGGVVTTLTCNALGQHCSAEGLLGHHHPEVSQPLVTRVSVNRAQMTQY